MVATAPLSKAELRSYSPKIRPTLSLEEAIDVCKTLLKQEKIKDYYIVGVYLFGGDDVKGSGSWSITYANEKSDKIITFGIDFPEDACSLSNSDQGKPKLFRRNGEKIEN